MTSIFILLVCFLGIGLFTRAYTIRTRVLMSGAVVALLIYLYLS